jgi:hypothetical protein
MALRFTPTGTVHLEGHDVECGIPITSTFRLDDVLAIQRQHVSDVHICIVFRGGGTIVLDVDEEDYNKLVDLFNRQGS